MKDKVTSTLFIVSLLLLASCRPGTAVIEGGDVISMSGSRDCLEGDACEFPVDDPNLSETFTAKPRAGFVFTGWRQGKGFLCGGSTDPSCRIALNGDAVSEAIVALEEVVYLAPEFVCIGECSKQPDFNWPALDETIAVLEEVRDLVESYMGTG